MDYEQTLSRLCTLSGPTGFETDVAQAAAELMRPLVDEVSVLRLGSALGVRRSGRENAPKLLLDAHLDEIGFIVTGHEDGFLKFASLGGVDPRMLPDREVTIMTDPPMLGVVACLPPHVQAREDMDKSIPISKSYIDIGLSQEEAVRLVPIGTPVTFREGCGAFGDGLLRGKAMDDRSCFAVLLDVLEQLKGKDLGVDLYVLGSTQEEVESSAGAVTAAYGIIPDYCVAVDVTHAATPDAKKEETFPLGEGPVIGVGPNCAPIVSKRLKALAKELEIPFQIEVLPGNSGTNAWPLQVSREGIAIGVLSLPLQYMHTPVEVCAQSDLENTARLLAAFVERFETSGEEAQTC